MSWDRFKMFILYLGSVWAAIYLYQYLTKTYAYQNPQSAIGQSFVALG